MAKNDLTSINAKDYERIANRISLPHTQETIDRQLGDAWSNVERELRKEGGTGRLTAPDGLVRLNPIPYKGFTIELYGRIVYRTQFDVYGQLRWVGTATGKIMNQGKEVDVIFDVEASFPNGIEDTQDAAKYFFGLIDACRRT
ncbi:MAG: hypothetical protein WC998_05110 [Candidatus Paceibacterota bacterium]|jgi:hypothetical protein